MESFNIETKKGSKRGSKTVYTGSNPSQSLFEKTGYKKQSSQKVFLTCSLKKVQNFTERLQTNGKI
jgi:hypothetical protein